MVPRSYHDVFEAQTQRLRSHRLIRLAREGRLPSLVLARYLGSVLHLLRRTEPHLRLATSVAKRRRLPELVAFFSRKANEEKGHDAWAQADLHELSRHLATEVHAEPLPAVHALVEFIERSIVEDPHLYLIYVVANEYLMASAGPAWLCALTRGSGVPVSALTVLSRHIAADQAHTDAGLDDADRLLPASFSKAAVGDIVSRVVDQFDCLFTQIVEEVENYPSARA